MLGQMAIGGIAFTGQSTAQALTSGTAAKTTMPNASALPTTGTRQGDPAVKPDPTNSQIQVNAPGIYKVSVALCGIPASAMNVIADLRKTVNGSQAAISGARQKQYFPTTNNTQIKLETLIEVLQSDLPSAGGQPTFADPSAAAGAGKPNGGFAGAGAAPKTGVYLDVALTADASANLTLSDGQFLVERVG
jgi:uncharacterized protein YukE